jgi:tRNA (cytidine32/uridine32-2'-O)-methyltransferase
MIAVAVVGAETPGNVGTIARAMKNFGLEELLLVDPPPLPRDSEAYGFAGKAREDVLPGATEVAFDHLVENYHTVACTATTNEDARSHVRFPFRTPAELADSLGEVEADTCVVFGREGDGLRNEELARLDEVCSIPASDDYPVLNLGQAATVVLYELRGLTVGESQHPDLERERADEAHLERLYDQFENLLSAVEHPEEKRAKTMRLLRRVAGRAHLTEREAITLTGIFRRARTYRQRRDADE